MSRAVMQQALGALEIAVDLATEQCNELRASLGSRCPEKHAAADRDAEQIEGAAKALRAVLAQQDEPVAIPAGYALVPVEPTPEMAKAGYYRYCKAFIRDYKAMIAAAPQPDPCDMGDLCIGCTPRADNVYPGAAPQPAPVAQSERAPLTDEQARKLRDQWFEAKVDSVSAFIDGLRAGERAHKIGGAL